MKYIILFFAILLPGLAFAQTPSIYDEWSPQIAGSMIHVRITDHEIIVRHQASGLIKGIPKFLTAPMQQTESPAAPVNRTESPLEKLDTVRLLKVVFDSAQAKGRLFVRFDMMDSFIIPLSFLIKDNGEAEIGLAGSPFTLMMGKGNMKSLKEVERATRPSSKNKHKNDIKGIQRKVSFDGFENFTFTFYNSSRTAEFAKLKDPTTMPKEEMIGMMNSFGDRLAAELQALPQDSASNNPLAMFSYFGPLFQNIQHIANDLFIAHGYNPLGAASCIEKFKEDEDIKAAGKVLGDKVEQSIPELREKKRLRDSSIEARKNEYLIPYGNDAEGIAEARKLMDMKSPIYDATGTLTTEQKENLLKKIGTHTSSDIQFSVVIVSSLHGNTPEKAADMVDHWYNTCNKYSGNSSVIFLAKDERKGFITNGLFSNDGHGSSNSIPDSNIQRIFNDVLTPSLKQGNYYEGIDKTIDAIAQNEQKANNMDLEMWQIKHSASMQSLDSMAALPIPPGIKAPPPAPASSQDEFVEFTDEPKALEQIKVKYPVDAKKAGVEGTVTYSALIGKDGKVQKVSISKSDNEIFNQAVIDAVMRVRFSPAMKDGKPVRVWSTQKIKFKLNSETVEPDQR